MQPLTIAVLSALTPLNWQRTFFDDRLEPIDFDQPTDLAAISIETYTAKRGYQIAAEYRKRGVKVVMGGYHATFCPEEVLLYADAVCVGEAENIWGEMLEDCEKNRLSGQYRADSHPDLDKVRVDRSIFDGKPYLDIVLVETSRGCSFKCKFCSITSFHGARHRKRPADSVVGEIQEQQEKIFFFVDDNIVCDPKRAKDLFKRIKGLGIQWIGQAGITIADDPELVDLIVDSGCLGLLIGFESLSSENLERMGKKLNRSDGFQRALGMLRKRGIIVYGTFLFGYPFDTPDLISRTVRFAVAQKMFLAAFNHLIPFPGTPLYDECENKRSLNFVKWWLNDDFRFGQVPYQPQSMSSEELELLCHEARKEFYSIPSIFKRGLDFSANIANAERAKLFLSLNLLLRKEVSQKRGLPLGLRNHILSKS